jgi:hypothetical protein
MADAPEYARRLYAEFFMFDSLGCELILAEYPPENGIGRAVANRLLKASGASSLKPSAMGLPAPAK